MGNFTLTDLVSFGEYLLSKERKKTIQNHPIKGGLSERLKKVSDADIANWKDLKSNNMTPQVTAILLNWKRPENLSKVIKSIRSQTELIDIWLWNNSKMVYNFDVDQYIHSSTNLKCFPRWCLASMVQTKYFFVIDDDIRFNDNRVISDCINSFEKSNIEDLIIGHTGVILNDEKIYFDSEHFSNVVKTVNVDIVKGRFMFMKQSLMNSVTMDVSFTCEDIKISSHSNNKVLPAFLHNRFVDLEEGEEALFRTEGQKELRQLAVNQFFCK